MKRIVWCAGILLLIVATSIAQTNPKKTTTKKAAPLNTVPRNKEAKNSNTNAGNIVKLSTANSYSAKSNSSILLSPQTTYKVTDPILTTLDKRAGGAKISFNKSGIVGMPKGAYGFADGRILLRTTGAVTSGTQTGSGAVGTGTSQATFGSIGAPMNVNGKRPYAGINMWGNAMNMNILRRDSSVRTPLSKHNY